MLTVVLSIIPVIVLATGFIFYFSGSAKNNAKLKGIGIGFIISLFILEAPNLIQGFLEGFASGFTD
ncbi:hypothetical protein [Aquibacillus rhizosphaerae]|uniref:Uncharacterized protein n=1 Tax=Aquibacillus rhizosphaerae TaxID=3051431 RepID=A0ABT7L918_9BACI|nr:hypothetical protein [Aquibacillus sp. LR5S19]MDL4842357.1 hypothetical protein [Aquibacillus sp. LR5S19]